jgi:hypothetical protein
MDLEGFGFVEVGQWRLRDSPKSGVTFTLDRYQNDRVIYAFVVDGKPKYVGICDKSTTTLKDRMSRYRGMVGAGTNKRIASAIRGELERGSTVKILALRPRRSFQYSDLYVDLVKGLENPLLEAVDPDWNIHK